MKNTNDQILTVNDMLIIEVSCFLYAMRICREFIVVMIDVESNLCRSTFWIRHISLMEICMKYLILTELD